MITKGIRGAITVDENTEDAIRAAILELLGEMFRKNDLTEEKISHIIFTVTHDLNAAFPAKFARLDMGLSKTAMMCFNELDVPGARQDNTFVFGLSIHVIPHLLRDLIAAPSPQPSPAGRGS